MKDVLEGKREEPFLRIPLRILKNQRFKRWLGTREFQVWAHLYASIIRAPMRADLPNFIFKKYYKNGILAARWSQENMLKELGLNSKGYMSDLLKSLAEKGVLKKHKERWHNKNILVYELGTHSGKPYYHETHHAMVHFIQTDAEKTLDKFSGKITDIIE